MREDLIAILTDQVFSPKMYGLIKAFCSVSTKQKERDFVQKLVTFSDIVPEQLSIGKFFRLDKNSGID